MKFCRFPSVLAPTVFAFGSLLHAAISPDSDNGGLTLPPGFRAKIVADDLIGGRKIGNNRDNLRFLAVGPQGDLYAKTSRGGILALRDKDGDGRFEEVQEFGSGGGTGIALHDGWLYHSTNDAVYRYKLDAGQLVPTGQQETIVSGLPDGGQHNAKSFAFGEDGQLYVEIGSPSNAYGNPDRAYNPPGTVPKDPTEFLKTHGGFWRFDPNKLNQTQADGYHFSTGHRHVLALAWNRAAQSFFITQMGRDQLNVVAPEYYDELDNAERVSEVMHRLHDGANFGWPYSYWDPFKKARMVAPEFGGDNRKREAPAKFDAPVVAFPAHWAPLQMAFYYGAQFPEKFRGGAFVAFHGSWNRAPLPQDGFNICFVPFNEKGEALGSYEVFAANAGPQRYRMGGVAVAADGSLFISETDRGRIWRIFYTGETGVSAEHAGVKPAAHPEASAGASGATFVGPDLPGRALYNQICAVCHMPDGSGSGQMQPALMGSSVVAGDPAQLIAVVLRGPAEVLPKDRPKYENVMPAFAFMADKDIAELLTYVRAAFGKNATAVSEKDVAKARGGAK